jgi:hypothetical protein
MSYILDALKKSRAEEATDGVTLAMQPSAKTKSRPKGLLGLVIVLVLTNIGLLLWVTLPKPDASSKTAVTPVQTTLVDSGLADSRPAESGPAVPARLESPSDVVPVETQAAPPRPIQQIAQETPRKVSVRNVNLSDLPAGEQARFNKFNYSSHIFTDDPSLCAIVIDGQRLSAGDNFEGLEVVAITEEGVVFGTERTSTNGRTENLHVAVSVIEQWDR